MHGSVNIFLGSLHAQWGGLRVLSGWEGGRGGGRGWLGYFKSGGHLVIMQERVYIK